MAMVRLPGHAAGLSSVEAESAQRRPLRSTMAPHMAFPWLRPPASPFCAGAAFSNFSRSADVGTSAQPADRGGLEDGDGCDASRTCGPRLREHPPIVRSSPAAIPGIIHARTTDEQRAALRMVFAAATLTPQLERRLGSHLPEPCSRKWSRSRPITRYATCCSFDKYLHGSITRRRRHG
jgi:hypothetical protein